MLLLGLTGNIACGKSTVARLLVERGAAVLDSDLLVRELYADTMFAARVAQIFPTVAVLDAQGQVNRAALGQHVFSDAEALRHLEVLVHPAVAALRIAKLDVLQNAGASVVALEAVKLVESGQADVCHEVWCVTCTPEVQIQRLQAARGLSEDQARARLAAQPTWEAKAERLARLGVPCVKIDNSGTLEALSARVAVAWEHLLSGRAD